MPRALTTHLVPTMLLVSVWLATVPALALPLLALGQSVSGVNFPRGFSFSDPSKIGGTLTIPTGASAQLGSTIPLKGSGASNQNWTFTPRTVGSDESVSGQLHEIRNRVPELFPGDRTVPANAVSVLREPPLNCAILQGSEAPGGDRIDQEKPDFVQKNPGLFGPRAWPFIGLPQTVEQQANRRKLAETKTAAQINKSDKVQGPFLEHIREKIATETGNSKDQVKFLDIGPEGKGDITEEERKRCRNIPGEGLPLPPGVPMPPAPVVPQPPGPPAPAPPSPPGGMLSALLPLLAQLFQQRGGEPGGSPPAGQGSLVCGTDGVTYANLQTAQTAGVSVLHGGACPSTSIPSSGVGGAFVPSLGGGLPGSLLEQVVRVVVGMLLSIFQIGTGGGETLVPAGETVVGG